MLKRLFLGVVFCLIAATALAAEKEFTAFSIDLPEGWQEMGDPVDQGGVSMVMFMNQAKQSMAVLAFAPTGGADFKTLVEAARQNMTSQGMTLDVVKEEENRIVFTGKQADVDVTLVLTSDGQSLGSLTFSGNVDAAGAFAGAIKTKSAKLAFF